MLGTKLWFKASGRASQFWGSWPCEFVRHPAWEGLRAAPEGAHQSSFPRRLVSCVVVADFEVKASRARGISGLHTQG